MIKAVTAIVLFILAFSSVLPANSVQQSEGVAIVSPIGMGVIHGTIFNDLNGDRIIFGVTNRYVNCKFE